MFQCSGVKPPVSLLLHAAVSITVGRSSQWTSKHFMPGGYDAQNRFMGLFKSSRIHWSSVDVIKGGENPVRDLLYILMKKL